MIKEFWINLPVKDINKSKDFFTKLGFQFNTDLGNSEHSVCLLMGAKNVVVMLFQATVFEGFTNNDICNTSRSTEVLLSYDAPNKTEVDNIVQKALDAGGVSSHIPKEMNGWMYGAVFSDLDGHKWNVLHMDMSKR